MTSSLTGLGLARFARPVALVALGGFAHAQVQSPPFRHVAVAHDSGPVTNDEDGERVVASFPVRAPGASWMRLYFEQVELAGDAFAGSAARLRITGHEDGAVQELNAIHVQQWQGSSAYFNGDAVQVEIVAPAHSGSSRVRVRAYDAGSAGAADPTICDATDDRAPSGDPRTARLLPVGCTGWLIEDCAHCFLTAGHCTSPLSVVQFNVPPSDADGSLNHPPPQDQYAVDGSSVQTNGGGSGIGDDWAHFGCYPNADTGLTPFAAQGDAFRLAAPPLSGTYDVRVTGYGADISPPESNQAQQTDVGPLVASTLAAEVGYRADTMGGSSGSPVILEDTGEAIGIHTHGGCVTDGGNNWGTAVMHPALQEALANPAGICGAGIVHGTALPKVLAPNTPTAVVADLLGTPVPGSVTLHYRYGAGPFQPLSMEPAAGTGRWTAELPPAGCADEPQFYFSATDESCGPVTSPPGAPAHVHSALVAELTLAFADDFETDTGWTTQVIGALSGAWQRGVPVDDPDWEHDPPADSDGSGQCFVTGNGFDDQDVDEGAVRLTSPLFDLGGGGVVSYDYFLALSHADGSDRLRVELNDAGGAGVWTEVVVHVAHTGLAWRTHAITSAELVAAGLTPNATMAIRFTANDADPQSIVEAGIDAFRVDAAECDPGAIGSRYCSPAVANSSGDPGRMRVTGSEVIFLNTVTLTADGLPVNQFGYFLTSKTQGFLQPPGSVGILCLGGKVGRYRSQIQSSGASGSFAIPIDLQAMPVSPPAAVLPGETWSFQAWFRDVVANESVSNFTDGVAVTFL